MSSCSCCGSTVPEGQGVCSMCYGDIDYGSDGYYREWAEQQEKCFNEEQEDECPTSYSGDLPF